MIFGALAVSTAVASEREHHSTNDALVRECDRYGLDYTRVLRAYASPDVGASSDTNDRRAWWDYAILIAAGGVFVFLGVNARVPSLGLNFAWLSILVVVLVASAALCGWALWKATRFS
jgi:hypothetical protein